MSTGDIYAIVFTIIFAVGLLAAVGKLAKLMTDINTFFQVARKALADKILTPEEFAEILKVIDILKVDVKEIVSVLIQIISAKKPSAPATYIDKKLLKRYRL